SRGPRTRSRVHRASVRTTQRPAPGGTRSYVHGRRPSARSPLDAEPPLRELPVDSCLQNFELAPRLDRLIPLVVPVPCEGPVVQIAARRRLLEWLEVRVGLPFGVEERRRKHRNAAATLKCPLHVLAAPVVLAGWQRNDSPNQLLGEPAP